MKRSVVVTGVGAVTPLGVGAPALHERWAAGECGIVDGEGAAREFEPDEHLSVKEARRPTASPSSRSSPSAEALAQAGWERRAAVRPDARSAA